MDPYNLVDEWERDENCRRECRSQPLRDEDKDYQSQLLKADDLIHSAKDRMSVKLLEQDTIFYNAGGNRRTSFDSPDTTATRKLLRKQDLACDACREREVECTGTATGGCLECYIHMVKCQVTKENDLSLNESSDMRDAISPQISDAALQTQKRACRLRNKDPGCDACRERRVKCDATETRSCSECSSRFVKCQFTKGTNRQMSSIKQVQDDEKQLAQVRRENADLRSRINTMEAEMDLDTEKTQIIVPSSPEEESYQLGEPPKGNYPGLTPHGQYLQAYQLSQNYLSETLYRNPLFTSQNQGYASWMVETGHGYEKPSIDDPLPYLVTPFLKQSLLRMRKIDHWNWSSEHNLIDSHRKVASKILWRGNELHAFPPTECFEMRRDDDRKEQDPKPQQPAIEPNPVSSESGGNRNDIDHATARANSERMVWLSRNLKKQELLERIEKAKSRSAQRRELRCLQLMAEKLAEKIEILKGLKAVAKQILSAGGDQHGIIREGDGSDAGRDTTTIGDPIHDSDLGCLETLSEPEAISSTKYEDLREGHEIHQDADTAKMESHIRDDDPRESEAESQSEEYSSTNEDMYENMEGEWLDNSSLPKPASMDVALGILKRALVERTMAKFWAIYDRTWTAKVSNYAGNANNSCSNSVSTLNSTTTSSGNQSSSRISRKRSRGSEDGCTSDADENNSQSSRSNSRNRQSPKHGLKLACPFRKHDPLKYNLHDYPICALSSWNTIARVKEHLNRVHKVPVYCERCKLQFKTAEALKSHLIVPDTEFCKLKEGPIPDGIGPELAIKLKSRKRSSPRQSESERWKDIFRLLFPEELVPMPCFDPIVDSTIITADESQTLSFGEFYRQELPRIFRAHLNATVNKKLKTLDDCFKTELVNMVKTCQSELASQWRFNHGNVGCPPFRTSIQASNLHNQAQLSGIPQQAGSNVRENPELQSCGKSEDKTAQNCKSTMEQSTFPQALPPESSLAVPGLCFCTGQCDCLRATGPTSTLPTTFGDLDMMTSQYEMDWSADMFNISWLDNSLNASSGTAFDTEP